jgi:hypothetical protein
MSKLVCSCGNVIPDQTDYLPYKGEVLKNQDREAFMCGVTGSLAEYIAGVRSRNLDEWHRERPWVQPGASDLTVLWAFLGWFRRKYCVDVYECESCGRLWVQSGTGSQRFIPFAVDEPSAGRVLPSEHYQEGDSSTG